MYKIKPNNYVLPPGTVDKSLIWMLICQVYSLPLWIALCGYGLLFLMLVGWVWQLKDVEFVDILAPLNKGKE